MMRFVNNWRWSKSYCGFMLFNVWWIPLDGISGVLICNVGIEFISRRSILHPGYMEVMK